MQSAATPVTMTAGAWAPSECPSEQSDPIHEFLQDDMRQRSRLSLVRSLIRFRNKRAGLFRDELFADPCWDMLLDLKMNALQGRSISVSSLCVAARVPPTTALRRIELLVHAGLARRRDDPSDKRRVLIGLTAYASKRLDTYLDDIMLTRIPNCPGSLRPCLIVKTVPHRGKHE